MEENLKYLREKAKNLEPILRIGKFGLSNNVYNEVEKLLKKRHLIKIKILNNCPMEKSEIIEKVLQKSKALLVSEIGNVFSIYRK
ncbi:MAG: YhbY family RNA-binding protein [Candidatus Woesearchaeota archaeon]